MLYTITTSTSQEEVKESGDITEVFSVSQEEFDALKEFIMDRLDQGESIFSILAEYCLLYSPSLKVYSAALYFAAYMLGRNYAHHEIQSQMEEDQELNNLLGI